MELVTYRIKRTRGDHKPVVVSPVGDIQWSGQRGSTALDHLRRHIDKTLALDGYFIGMGDYIDFLSPSNRQRMRAAALYDTAEDVIDDKAMDLVHDVYEKALKPTKGRWLGLLEGHHFSTLKTGETTDMRLCQMLGARFLGTTGIIRLQFDINGGRLNTVFWAHHGTGGGAKLAAPLNKLENLSPYWQGIDVFLQGHTTKSPAVPMNTIIPRWAGNGAPDLIHKKTYLVSTGGFSKAYTVGAKQGQVPRGDYAEQRMLNPTVIGAPIIRIVQRMRTEHGARSWAPEITVEI